MIREEAIAVLKGLMENPLFSDEHKAAFNIAIHDIKERHEWDINNLILINKENCEPLEQEPILDTIRAEIEEAQTYDGIYIDRAYILQIIDKYKAESEE